MKDCVYFSSSCAILSTADFSQMAYVVLSGKRFYTLLDAALFVKRTLDCEGTEAIHYVKTLPRVRATDWP